MSKTQHRLRHQSSKSLREDIHQRHLDAISSSIDTSKLTKESPLPTDRFGRVNIEPTHPDYHYWIEEE